jgi:hypothetical protein
VTRKKSKELVSTRRKLPTSGDASSVIVHGSPRDAIREFRVEMVPIEQVIPYARNPRVNTERSIAAVARSIKRYGWQQVILVDEHMTIIAGHTRLLAAQQLGHRLVPVKIARGLTPVEVRGLRIEDNKSAEHSEWENTNLAWEFIGISQDGGDLTDLTSWEKDEIAAALRGVNAAKDAADAANERAGLGSGFNPRNLPVDCFYSLSGLNSLGDLACAKDAGWGWGLISRAYPTRGLERHAAFGITPGFMDNEWHDYDHAQHLGAVSMVTPKYCTTRDVMTRAQCKEAGVTYYSLDSILKMAEELAVFARRVIVIPKFDCLADIPEQYVLGYSVQSSYGGTPVPAQKFKGRPVHLLGGSWKAQLGYLNLLGDSVVSLDNNHVSMVARYAQFLEPDGNSKAFRDAGFPDHVSPRLACIALSLGNMSGALHKALGTKPAKDEAMENPKRYSEAAITQEMAR